MKDLKPIYILIENFILSIDLFVWITIFILATLFLLLFLLPIFFHRIIECLKIKYYISTFFEINFYKLPLRWISLVFISLIAIFRKRERLYLNYALTKAYDYNLFKKEFLSVVGKEPIYSYSLFIANTVYYFQNIKTKTTRLPYSGVLGKLKLHTDFYMIDSTSDIIRELEFVRFNCGQWVNKKSEEHFLTMLKSSNNEYDLSYTSLDNIEIKTRTVTPSNRKRF